MGVSRGMREKGAGMGLQARRRAASAEARVEAASAEAQAEAARTSRGPSTEPNGLDASLDGARSEKAPRAGGGGRTILVLTLASFALGCSQQFIMGVPGAIADAAGVGLSEVGQLMTAFSVASALGAPLLLAALSRAAQRNQLLLGLALLAGGMTVLGVSSSYPVLLAARVVMGLGSGLFNATAMALAARLAAPGRQASALANMGLGSSAAQIIAMPLAQQAAPYVSWHVLYLVLAVYVALSCALIARSVPAERSSKTADLSLKGRFAPLRNPLVVHALCVMIVLNIGYSSFYTYVTPFLEGVYGAGSSAVSLVLLVSALMSAVGIKGGGWLTDHHGFQRTCVVVPVLQIVTLACLGLFSAHPAAVAVFMCLWVMADWGFNPSQNMLIARLAGDSAPMALALSGSALQLGNAVGSAIGGAFILVAPISALPVLSSACVVVTLVLEVALIRRLPKKGRGELGGLRG